MVATAVKKSNEKFVKEFKKQKNARDKSTKGNKDGDDSGSDDDLAAMVARCFLAPVFNTIPRTPSGCGPIVFATNLHNVENNCGIDSDAGMSISTLIGDFPLGIDSSDRAMASLPSPNGINGGASKVGGTGPMIVRAKSGELIIDPDGLYLKPGKDQPNFRVISTQRLKTNGVRVVGCFKGTNQDVMQDRTTKHTINLAEDGQPGKKILVLETVPCPSFSNRAVMKSLVEQIRRRNVSAMVPRFNELDEKKEARIRGDAASLAMEKEKQKDKSSIMLFNEANCSVEERSRLYVRRLGYCNSKLFPRMMNDKDLGDLPKLIPLNEDNPVNDAAKFKKKTHSRVPSSVSMGRPCWFRVYVDGYGGGQSMGTESYEGAIGGYLFVCSSTGDLHHKLYASHEQFPAAVFQFLTHVESEGYRCHELYCDTFSVNISAELEEILGLFQTKLVPVSAGTPEEVSFVETAHRVVGARSRAMMLGAPHLPKWCWALADKHSVYVGRLLPQSTRNWKSAYWLNRKLAPHWRNMAIHVFGAPCAYAPMEGPIHKRAARTEEGYFVGVQHPMVLILRKHDFKLISCSRKKVLVYESIYTLPLSLSSSQLEQELQYKQNESQVESMKDKRQHGDGKPQHVQSIKSISAHTAPPPNTTGTTKFRAPTELDSSAETQTLNSGEGVVVPEHIGYSSNLEVGISEMQERAKKEIVDPGIRQRVISSLHKARDMMSRVVEKGALKKGKQSSKRNIDAMNVIEGKRDRNAKKVKLNLGAEKSPKKVKMKATRKVKPFAFEVGDWISVDSKIFDGLTPGSYSDTHPERQIGEVERIWAAKDIVRIRWGDNSKSHHNAAQLQMEKRKINAAMIVAILIGEVLKKEPDPNDKTQWPKDFFAALVKPEWREWVAAVKKEIESWLAFNAYTEIAFVDRKPGSSIVPLGELYTRKRDGSFKFRQYLMGNLLKKGKDFDETFSACISWDGIRWSMSIACATGKEVRGLDAVTGFLQAKEQFNIYAFLPSHGSYSALSFEELAEVRMKLLRLMKKDGEQGLKSFAAAHKKESRVNPKTCYQLNSSIYGAPSANHEWDMLFQGAHVGKCGLTLSEVEPSLYVKMETNEQDEVVEWMIATIWTDDVRYFGTKKILDEYERELEKHIKVKFLGVPGEFVGVEIKQDLGRGLLEMKSPKYWETAYDKFAKYFPGGVSERNNPLSVYDEKMMLEEVVSDKDYEEAKDLPYRELCGVISYAAGCVKLEMRYAISICGKHRGKWGKRQFKILLKCFEYGFTTRHTGLIYSKGLDEHGLNVMYCYADSGHSLPRSYGSTVSMMNGSATSLSAKRHTLTASSTMHDESIEFSIAGNKMVGFRNMAIEMGFPQEKATTIYQDNEAAIQVMVNRGSLSKQSRHIERRVLTARNKIEDGQIMPKYCKTEEMVADIGTKALSDKQFAYLRDRLTGYALVKRHHPTYAIPSYVLSEKGNG